MTIIFIRCWMIIVKWIFSVASYQTAFANLLVTNYMHLYELHFVFLGSDHTNGFINFFVCIYFDQKRIKKQKIYYHCNDQCICCLDWFFTAKMSMTFCKISIHLPHIMLSYSLLNLMMLLVSCTFFPCVSYCNFVKKIKIKIDNTKIYNQRY